MLLKVTLVGTVVLLLFLLGSQQVSGWLIAKSAPRPYHSYDSSLDIVSVVPNPANQAPFEAVNKRKPIARSASFYKDFIIGAESGGMAGRLNKSSGACGVPQALPCTKIYSYATKEWIFGVKDKETGEWISPPHYVTDNQGRWFLPNPDPTLELAWTEQYMKDRYGTWERAYWFWTVGSCSTAHGCGWW